MYLSECFIKLVGPIEQLDIKTELNSEGDPKPIVLVGENGSGKSLVLSYIADALTELAKLDYSDMVPSQQDNKTPYFRWVSPTNQRSGASYGIALLKLTDDDNVHFYIDKTGSLEPASLADLLAGRFSNVQNWPTEGNHKSIYSSEAARRKQFFEEDVVAYFPPSRKEYPHWLNPNGLVESYEITIDPLISGLLQKPIFVESSVRRNKRWILDLILDSQVPVEVLADGSVTTDLGNLYQRQGILQSRKLIESLLQLILEDPTVRFGLGFRNSPPYRLHVISKDGAIVLPSLDNLSSGQSILFNMFATIVRYADKKDPTSVIRFQDIEGIVLIDEIDAHLHTKQQYEVLPRLVRLFPKVQFVITSHSPLFLLGMKNEFGEAGFQLIDMPSGMPISTERFTEFEHSFKCYKQTEAFENEIKSTLAASHKPLILTEGSTDRDYIRAAFQALDNFELQNAVEVETPNTGKDGLNKVQALLKASPQLTTRPILLIYDKDANKDDEDYPTFSVRNIPSSSNTIVTRGIESLLPESAFEKRFYTVKTTEYGEARAFLDKSALCLEVCTRNDPREFAGFQSLLAIISSWVHTTTGVRIGN